MADFEKKRLGALYWFEKKSHEKLNSREIKQERNDTLDGRKRRTHATTQAADASDGRKRRTHATDARDDASDVVIAGRKTFPSPR